jgi:hypothetical protein
MSNFFSSTYTHALIKPGTEPVPFEIAIVERVILNIDDIKQELPEIEKIYQEISESDYIDKNTLFYASIKYKLIGSGKELNEEILPYAFPYKRDLLNIPVVGEFVKIYNLAGRDFYEKISYENSPNFSTNKELYLINHKFSKEGEITNPGEKSESYNEHSQVGISEITTGNSGKNETIRKGFAGKYFKRNLRIHQLALKEGDTLLQGRFGNSIRFSGYIHDDTNNGIQYPAILIRNGESSDNQKKKVFDVVSEDINNDGTSIQITSGKYKTLFSSTIKVKKEANQNYPSSDQLIGDQIVVNSGRVILSSKTAETFLFSKKAFSVFSDDVVTIDSEKGIKYVSQNGNIEISAKNNKNIIFKVGTGAKIYHGKDGADQQAILGNKLVDLIGKLIDVINNMQFNTYMGPTVGPGPMAPFKTQLTTIKTQLKTTLSKNNYLV